MKNIKLVLVTLLTLAAIPWAPLLPANAQSQSTALERGYRTGYSDGYNAGFNDVNSQQPRDFQSKEEFQKADRSYSDVWGPIEDYRDGYQQGFEVGYTAGYDKMPFNSSIPNDLHRRSVADTQSTQSTENDNPVVNSTSVSSSGSVSLPRNSVLLVELLAPLSTDVTQRGDRFEARVVEPHELDGAIVEGRVSRVKRAGKVKGVAELQLDFRTIRMPDRRVADLSADVVEVLPMSGQDNVGEVDPEGGVRGRDSTKDDVSKVGAATGIGAIIGAIAGGGKGAAIGAAIGGGIGTGGVLSQRGKDIRLERGQQLRIRTATDVAINSQIN